MENENQENKLVGTTGEEKVTEQAIISKKEKLHGILKNAWDLIKFAIIALIIVIPIRMFIAQPFIVSGSSMYPTFRNGQYLIADEISYIVGNPKRNDIIIFRYPDDPSRFFIKRVIGLPNEEINIKDGKITIINKTNPEGFVLAQPYLRQKFNFTGSYKTGNKQYFVMGDNRKESLDSRIWGMLPDKLVTGRAVLRLLPFKYISYLPGYYISNK